MRVKNLLEKLKYKSLEKLGSNLIITQKLILSDKYGKKLDEQFKVSESLVGNFLQLLYCSFSQKDTINFVSSNFNGTSNNNSLKTVTGVISPLLSTSGSDCNIELSILSPANNGSFGMLFGTDSTTPSPLDYKLNAPIANGNGVGQLNYLAQGSIQAPIAAGSNTSFILQRIATNTSGGTINVNEVGIYFYSAAFNTYGNYACIYRDVANQPVLNTQTLTCQITFQITT